MRGSRTVNKGKWVETLKRFRLLAVRMALLLTFISAVISYALLGKIVAHGLLLGGIAGIVAFWITAVRIEKLAKMHPKKLKWNTATLTIFRCAIYVVTLWQAYTLDKVNMRGFIASVAGIFIIRLVILIIGLTGIDLRKEKE